MLMSSIEEVNQMHTHTHMSDSPTQTEGCLIRWASFYDVVVNILTLGRVRRLRNLTVELVLLKPGESVLDVGCGTGGVTLPSKQRVGKTGKAAGIDPASDMITVAKQKASRMELDIDFRIGVIESLPYPDSTFDASRSQVWYRRHPKARL
jgi:ubiquinone/menaquinone biosynthesis C-methylase UbiE